MEPDPKGTLRIVVDVCQPGSAKVQTTMRGEDGEVRWIDTGEIVPAVVVEDFHINPDRTVDERRYKIPRRIPPLPILRGPLDDHHDFAEEFSRGTAGGR